MNIYCISNFYSLPYLYAVLIFIRVLALDPHNIEAMKYRALHVLCRLGNYEEAAQNLRTLYAEMDRSEPNNAALFVHMAQLFSRLVRKWMCVHSYVLYPVILNMVPHSVYLLGYTIFCPMTCLVYSNHGALGSLYRSIYSMFLSL